MIELLTKADVEEFNNEKNDQYYIPGELFNGMQYNLVRLEVDELELVRRDGRNVYVRKIASIF